MIGRREKIKLCALQCWIDTYKCVYQMLTEKNVPYSSRVLKQFIRAVSSMQEASSDSSDAGTSSQNFDSLSNSASPPRKQLSTGNRIRERNGLSHYLRKHALQRVLFAEDTFIKNS